MLRAKLHSTDPKAVKATEGTILQLIRMQDYMSCVFKRRGTFTAHEELDVDDEGWVELYPMPNVPGQGCGLQVDSTFSREIIV